MNLNKYTAVAFDTPTIDYIIPSERVLDGIMKNKSISVDIRTAISTAYEDLNTYLKEIGYQPGDKKDVSPDYQDKLLGLMERANEAFGAIDFSLRQRGGTGANKLVNFTALSDASGILVGCVSGSTSGNSKYIIEGLKSHNIHLEQSNFRIKSTRKSLIMTPKGSHDRAAATFTYNPPAIYKDQVFLLDQAAKADGVFIESALINMIGDNEFQKKDNFYALLDYCKSNGVDIHFSYPTKQNLAQNADYMRAFDKAAEYANTISVNEKEAVYATGKPDFKGSIYLGDNFKFDGNTSSIPDENLKNAVETMQSRLKKHPNAANGKPKVVFITVGEAGSFAITADKINFREAKKNIQVENTIGAGDAFAGSAIAEYVKQTHKKETITLDTDKMLKSGNNVAAMVIQQTGAQMPKDVILAAAEDKVPTKGILQNFKDFMNKVFSAMIEKVYAPGR